MIFQFHHQREKVWLEDFFKCHLIFFNHTLENKETITLNQNDFLAKPFTYFRSIFKLKKDLVIIFTKKALGVDFSLIKDRIYLCDGYVYLSYRSKCFFQSDPAFENFEQLQDYLSQLYNREFNS